MILETVFMKRIIFSFFVLPAFLLFLPLSSCSPVAYKFVMERSGQSSSGLDLSGKSIAVVYAYPERSRDSLLAAEVGQGFVAGMEEAYFLGADAMPLFNISASQGGGYSEKDTLVKLVMDTGLDVVFVFHSFGTGDLSVSTANVVELPFDARLSVYDSMSPEDTVRQYDYGDSFLWSVQGGLEKDDLDTAVFKDLPNAAFRLGGEIASVFTPQWNEEIYTIILYDSDSEWMDAAEMAVFDMKWAEAMKIWMDKADTGNLQKGSAAAYNCALGCYILGQYGLAEKWLDYSDSLYRITSSTTLRNRISEAKVR